MNDERSTGWELVTDLMGELELQFLNADERERYPDLYEAYRALVEHINREDRRREDAQQ